ncbi:autophagy protein 5 [Linderina macrospora]|uniref:Autophagy protein 5 n=1 Tax=Linderina macrospora TaxID=4868 RepID=A0ACC1J1B8_9FUNG|nr:autophagy protein 5 [Linderina macrospora]
MSRSPESGPLRKVWASMIPVEIQLAPADAIELLASATLPEPFQVFYMLVPRVSYLPFVSTKLKEQWIDPMLAMSGTPINGNDISTIAPETDYWFEYKGIPLKWHYPIGLLYDLYVNSALNDEPELPWSLTVHVRKFPDRMLIPSPSAETMRNMAMAVVKEADFVRYGSTKRTMDLGKTEQFQLLDGLETNSFEKYAAIHSILVPTPDPRAPVSSSGPKFQPPKAVPLRFYTPGTSTTEEFSIRPVSAGGRPASSSSNPNVGLSQLRHLNYNVHQCPIAPTKEADGDTDKPTTLADAYRTCVEQVEQVTGKVCLCQGIRVPWETPVGWLTDNLVYADCFLHLVVVSASSSLPTIGEEIV